MKKISLFIALMCVSTLIIADPIASEYCGYEGDETKSGDTYVTLTWETLANGDVQITLGSGTGATTAAFRNGGFEGGIDAFVVSTDNFENTTPASTYFTAEKVYSGNTFTLVKIADLPANVKIKHVGSGHALAWKVNDKDAYTFPDFIYTYGGVCAEDPVLTKIALSASASNAKPGEEVTLTASASDQFGKPMDVEITYEITPADAGSISENVYTPAKLGAATITAKSGAVSASIVIYGVPSGNLAEGKPSEAGYNPENAGEQAGAANDGKDNSAWVTWANRPASEEWWYVDLEAKYDLTGIDVLWGADYSTEYILQVRVDAPEDEDKADDAKWETVATITDAAANSSRFSEFTEEGRYVRIHSLSKSNVQCIRLREVRVFGTEWVPKDDTEKPVMVKAELVDHTWNSATISVEATDNFAVKKYHIVDATNAIDITKADSEGQITLEGLKQETEYNLVVTAIDAAGNESENTKQVSFNTGKIASEYCAAKMSSGDTEAAFVWETNAEGAIIIRILETLGGADEDTHFRGNGIDIDKIEVGETKETAETYFDLTCEGNTIILSLKDPNNAPAAGTKIYVTNKIIEYTTSKDGNAWPTLTFEYTYGGICLCDPELTKLYLSASSLSAEVGDSVKLTVSAIDQLGKPMEVAVEYELNPADAGKVENNVFIPAKAGDATIIAKSGTLSAQVTIACAEKPEPEDPDPEDPDDGGNTGNEDVETVPHSISNAHKIFENGKLVIIKNGVRYNAQGVRIY